VLGSSRGYFRRPDDEGGSPSYDCFVGSGVTQVSNRKQRFAMRRCFVFVRKRKELA